MKTAATFVMAALLGLASFAQAHMEMMSPPPPRSRYNKFTTDPDYDIRSPLRESGADFPCKNSHQLLGTPQGQSVADWMPGQSYTMTMTGGTPHNGGSCQASLSYDKGVTWKVLKSWIGNCPHRTPGQSNFDFTIPSNTPAGKDVLFAWTWFNWEGNREMYMNCAVVNILGSRGTKRDELRAQDSLAGRPDMFTANIGNGCGTIEGADVMFPDPGPEVEMNSAGTAPPVGNCAGGGSKPKLPPKSARPGKPRQPKPGKPWNSGESDNLGDVDGHVGEVENA